MVSQYLKSKVDKNHKATPIHIVSKDSLAAWLKKQPAAVKEWVKQTGFTAESGTHCVIPNAKGKISAVLFNPGKHDALYPWNFAQLPNALPHGTYQIEGQVSDIYGTGIAVCWALGCYQFNLYKKPGRKFSTLIWPQQADRKRAHALIDATILARHLITAPANDLGPAELATEAQSVAEHHKAKFSKIVGKNLLKNNYPAIYTVGQASTREPLLVDFTWGNPKHPKITLVGKGVCFDSGGLDIKPPGGMLNMKKDMGGAATVLALAHMIMDARLPVRLRVLIPAVENAIAGNAYRPLDVIRMRSGLSVEVGDTDAEGRLILADALSEADDESPDLIIDFATLTGAARVALGPELPALFCNNDKLAEDLLASGQIQDDPLWRLPLWAGYKNNLDSRVAELSSTGTGGFAGAIHAALFLEQFIGAKTKWIHIDTFAWNAKSKPGRPEGGEPLGLRAVFALLEKRYT